MLRETGMTLVAGLLVGLMLPVARNAAGAFLVGAIVAVAIGAMIWRTSPVLVKTDPAVQTLLGLGPVFALTGGVGGILVRRRYVRKRMKETRVRTIRGQENQL